MDIFKIKTGVGKIYRVSQECFQNVTGKKSPYAVKSKDGSDSYYAVCPECDNPIQLFGLFKDTVEGGQKPHGRHHGKSVPHLAEYDRDDYLDCSYANVNWTRNNTKRKPDGKIANEILCLLREQFDRIIYLVQKDTEIYVSLNAARQMLESFIANEGWLYRDVTMNNLPWTFFGAQNALPLFGKKICAGGELHQTLERNCPELDFIEAGKYVKIIGRDKQFVDLHHLLLDHTKEVRDDHLYETIDFWVYRGSAPHIENIYRKTITIETQHFMNLITLPPEKSHRNNTYLNIAAELIP